MKEYLAYVLAGVAALSLFMVPHVSRAQNADGIEIKPGVVEDRVSPGDVYKFTLRVKNLYATPQTFYIEKEDIQGLDEDGKPVFAGPGLATGYELTQWISTDKSSVDLMPGESQAVDFVVKVPKEATPGSHFGGVFFTVKPTKTSTTGTGVGIQVGSVVSLRISGDTTEEGRLREFSSERLVYDQPHVEFRVRVEDLGNILLRPHGTIEISDMRGKQIATVRVNDTAAPIFPGTDRIYKPEWNHDGFAIGRYQAVLSLAYGEDSRKTISSVTSFWVLPMKPILGILGFLVAAVIALYITVRVYIRRKLREMGINPGKNADTAYYERKYNKSATRMVVMIATIFLFILICVTALFLMFA